MLIPTHERLNSSGQNRNQKMSEFISWSIGLQGFIISSTTDTRITKRHTLLVWETHSSKLNNTVVYYIYYFKCEAMLIKYLSARESPD